jgi:hypothetical protein
LVVVPSIRSTTNSVPTVRPFEETIGVSTLLLMHPKAPGIDSGPDGAFARFWSKACHSVRFGFVMLGILRTRCRGTLVGHFGAKTGSNG